MKTYSAISIDKTIRVYGLNPGETSSDLLATLREQAQADACDNENAIPEIDFQFEHTDLAEICGLALNFVGGDDSRVAIDPSVFEPRLKHVNYGVHRYEVSTLDGSLNITTVFEGGLTSVRFSSDERERLLEFLKEDERQQEDDKRVTDIIANVLGGAK